MKKFLTSCWGRNKQFPVGAAVVQTSSTKSPYFNPSAPVLFTPELVPEDLAEHKNVDAATWKRWYREQLERLHKSGRLEKIISDLPDGAVLCCYEADAEQCHRKILADYLNEMGLAAVEEMVFVYSKKPAAKSIVAKVSSQLSMF